MAIILEGPDAAGKSTLARSLCNQFGFRHVISAGAPKGDEAVLRYCVTQLDECAYRDVVIDRITPISHPIYDPSYVGNEVIEHYLGEILNHPNTLVVYCRPPTEALMRPEKHEWKEYDTEEHKQKILDNQMVYIQRYDEFFHKNANLPYDHTDEGDYTIELVAHLAASKTEAAVLGQLQALMRYYVKR